MPGASWMVSTNILILRVRNLVSSCKTGRSHRSNAGISSREYMFPGGHAHDTGYLELHDTHHVEDSVVGSARTGIREEGPRQMALEEGVVSNTIAFSSVHEARTGERQESLVSGACCLSSRS